MRILFVASSFPYPTDDGLKGTVFAALQRLSTRHAVTLLTWRSAKILGQHLDVLRALGVEVRLVEPAPERTRARKVWNLLFESVPDLVAAHRSPDMANAIRRVADSGGFDVLHLDFVPMAQYVDDAGGLPVVVNAVDSFSLNYARRARAQGSWLLRRYFQTQADRFAAFEERWLPRASGVLIHSRDDVAYLGGGVSRAKVAVVPQGVDADYFAAPEGAGDPYTVVFHGNIGYHPNIHAVHWLHDRIMPLVWARRPETKLIVAGQSPPGPIRAMARDPRVTVTGALDDIRPAIVAGLINANPIELGTGVKNKILEAMAMERAVVGTTTALRGIDTAIRGEEIAVADTTEAFAGALLELMENPEAAREMGRKARRRVVADYPRERFVHELERLYQEALR